jgi:hypothetical protein
MKNLFRRYSSVLLTGVLSLLLSSCGGSGGGAADDEATVRYQVEMTDGGAGCLSRIEYLNADGNRRYVNEISETEWRQTIYAKDGAQLYLRAEIDCGEVTIYIYLNGSRAARDRSTTRATLEGTLRIDEEGNATFEEAD